MQITPAVNYSPLCKPRENRPFGFPVTGQRKTAAACLSASDKTQGTGAAWVDVSGIKYPDVYLCVLLFLRQDEQIGAQLCPYAGATAVCWV